MENNFIMGDLHWKKIQSCIMPKDGKETMQLKIVKIIFTNFIVKEMC
jgi:hypothetical protein